MHNFPWNCGSWLLVNKYKEIEYPMNDFVCVLVFVVCCRAPDIHCMSSCPDMHTSSWRPSCLILVRGLVWENLKAFQILADKTLMRVECNVMFSCLRGHGVQLYNHWLPYIYIQSYQMHLKSSNGPIDVLVCPETEDDLPQSPCPSSAHLLTDSQTSTPIRAHLPPGVTFTIQTPETQQHEEFGLRPEELMQQALNPVTSNMHISMEPSSLIQTQFRDDLDISLSSAADVTSGDLDELMASYQFGMGHDTLLSPNDLIPFETLDPPLHMHEDFTYTLDDTSEGIHELFDLVTWSMCC